MRVFSGKVPDYTGLEFCMGLLSPFREVYSLCGRAATPQKQTPEPNNRTSVPVWLYDVLDPKSFSSWGQALNLDNRIAPVSPLSLTARRMATSWRTCQRRTDRLCRERTETDETVCEDLAAREQGETGQAKTKIQLCKCRFQIFRHI